MTDEIIDGEVWKAYPHDPRYLVSNTGRVRGPSGKVLIGWKCRGGYLNIGINYGRHKKKNMLVHRMVLETFVSDKKSENACHNNGDRLDNRLENLRWDTMKGNQGDRLNHGTHQLGEKNPASKLSEGDVELIKEMSSNGDTQTEIAKRFKVSQATIWSIVSGKTWSWLTTDINENTLSAEVG